MATQNTLFVLFAATNLPLVSERVALFNPAYPVLSLNVSAESVLLIAPSTVTTQELSDKIGISDGSTGTGILVRVENFYGRWNNAVWEWIAAKMGVPLGNQASQTT